ncbi:MAG: alpha/beta hydrolase [Clostridia bacterium]|nr:alpha/beta hydrolase [Clostridia bacterium]
MENLWANGVPYWDDTYIEGNESAPRVPTITVYEAHSKGAVVVFPGGGYVGRAKHEGEGYAKWLQSIGITAFVVEYRVAPYKHPAQISDAMRAVKYVRYHAEKYGIDKDKIAVMGSSAGGHLAGSVSVHFDKKMYEPTDEVDNESCRPNASILCYPVIDMFDYRHDGSKVNLIGERALHADKELMSLYMHVTEDTPQAFIWHTSSDQAVPVENSLMYADALSKKQIPFELHIYPLGHHGLGRALELPYVAQWTNSLENWFELIEWK